MIWVIGFFIIVLLLVVWILVAKLEIRIDSRIPEASINLKTVGRFNIWYSEEWRAQFSSALFSTTIDLNKKKPARAKLKSSGKKPASRRKISFRRIINIIRRSMLSFHVEECRIYIDTGDYPVNAQLYSLQALPLMSRHLYINFKGLNYVVFKATNRSYRVLVACIKGYYSKS